MKENFIYLLEEYIETALQFGDRHDSVKAEFYLTVGDEIDGKTITRMELDLSDPDNLMCLSADTEYIRGSKMLQEMLKGEVDLDE